MAASAIAHTTFNGTNGHAFKMDFSSFYNTINNELTSTVKTRHSINPATITPNAEVPVSSYSDVDLAVASARKAFKPWSTTPIEERRKALLSFADAMTDYKEDFVRLLTLEQGKPLAQSDVEFETAVGCIRAFSNMELPEEVLEESDERKVIQRYTPLGVCCGIIPWNFPILLACGKIAPALITGNTIIIKPSPYTPYCGLKLGELARHFFPPGVLQVLSGEDGLGPMLTAHPDIDKIGFTGSCATGKKVMESCAKTLKRVTLELGGNDAAIICEDVDIEKIVPKVCMMIKRLYVHSAIYPQFLRTLAAHTRTLKSGDGFTNPDAFIGPVQNEMQYEKVKTFFDDIPKEGWKPVVGGTLPKDSKGYFITPTIIDNPPETSRIVTEEPFGPILPVLQWESEEDVIARANDTKMGLGASVWSKDIDRAARMARKLEAGSVWVNSHFNVDPGVPYGGHKWSGVGTEWGVSGLKLWCNCQSLWVFAAD